MRVPFWQPSFNARPFLQKDTLHKITPVAFNVLLCVLVQYEVTEDRDHYSVIKERENTAIMADVITQMALNL